MRITVITVTYNCASTLQTTIDSVVRQHYSDVEYIVVDGGSTDGTVELIEANADHITRWVSEPDRGIYDAMNKGVAMSTGDFVYFLGGDDRLHRNVLEAVAAKMNDPQAIYYGNVNFVGERQGTYDGPFTRNKLIRRNICHQSIFYPAQVLKAIPFDLRYKTYADYVLNMELWGRGYPFEYLNITVADFTVGGMSIGGDKVFFENRRRIVSKHLGFLASCYYIYRIQGAALIKKFTGRNG